MRYRILFLVPLLLAACASEPRWHDVSGQPRSIDAALELCRARVAPYRNPIVVAVREDLLGEQSPLIASCMAELGYVRR